MDRKANKIQVTLDQYYPSPPIPLDHSNEFTLLVAVVLSAQTTDGKVNEVTKDLFKHAKTPCEMSKLDSTFVLDIIRPVGLAPKKSQYIINLSKDLVNKFDGKVPSTFEELESLPGVGHKTASVIMSQLFGIPSFAVDTHVHRLALRWGLSKDQKNVNNVQKDLCKVFPQESWNKMIYFGREYCTAKDHTNSLCPICSWVNNTSDSKLLKNSSSIIHQDNKSFSPKKKSKSIIYYSDRVSELSETPSLIYHSPNISSYSQQQQQPTSSSLVIEIKNEIESYPDFTNFNNHIIDEVSISKKRKLKKISMKVIEVRKSKRI